MLAYIAKFVASSLRSNFPKLVFGHLHVVGYKSYDTRRNFHCRERYPTLLVKKLDGFLLELELLSR